MSKKFDEFELQFGDSKRDVHLLFGEKEGHEVKFAHLYDMINDLEQYSRGNCLLFVSIKERDDEDMDVSAGCLHIRA